WRSSGPWAAPGPRWSPTGAWARSSPRAMQIQLIAVGTRMPAWVQEGFAEYAKRLPCECSLQLVEIPLGKRGKNADVQRAIDEEGERLLAALPRDGQVSAMELTGRPWSTEKLARELEVSLGAG